MQDFGTLRQLLLGFWITVLGCTGYMPWLCRLYALSAQAIRHKIITKNSGLPKLPAGHTHFSWTKKYFWWECLNKLWTWWFFSVPASKFIHESRPWLTYISIQCTFTWKGSNEQNLIKNMWAIPPPRPWKVAVTIQDEIQAFAIILFMNLRGIFPPGKC